MKKSEIKKEAEKLKKEKGLDVVHATSDGQLFLEVNAANLHANSNAKVNAKGTKLKVYTFEDEVETETEDENPSNPMNAKDTIAKIATIESLEELKALEAAEVEGQSRKTVLEAIAARNAELQPDGGEQIDEERKNEDL